MSSAQSLKPEPLLVACLCAQWCGVCRDYAPLMARALEAFDAALLHVVWVDIEDNEDALGDLDVDSFPTLLLARGDEALFFGTVVPHAQTLERLVQGALAGDLAPLPRDAERQTLVARVRSIRSEQG